VGAGTGTRALGWKGGIGTASRLAGAAGGTTVGVLVQSNFGGRLTVDGIPVWRELGPAAGQGADRGSCMIVVATDAPLDARQLERLSARAVHAMARTGASGSHGSGDYVVAFSTTRRFRNDNALTSAATPADAELSPLFEAVIETTEEAILNSILKATTVRGRHGHIAEAIPIEALRDVLARHGRAMPERR
jgi:D-aminopeptidase